MERDFRGGNGMNVDHIATYDEDAAAAIKETLTEGAEATVDYTEERNAFIQKVLEAAFFAIREHNENVHELRWRWAGPEKEGSIDIIMVGPPGVNPCRDHVDDYATIGHCLKDAHFSVNIVLGWDSREDFYCDAVRPVQEWRQVTTPGLRHEIVEWLRSQPKLISATCNRWLEEMVEEV